MDCSSFLLMLYLTVRLTQGSSVYPFHRLTESRSDIIDVTPARSRHDHPSCCDRQQKKQWIGYGLDGEQLFVDVGQCRQSCSSHHKIHRKEFEAYLKANASLDPVQLFLSMQQQAAPKSCGVAATCLPKLTSMERHMITSGPQQVAVIEDCACTAEASRCQRVPSDVVYFPGTPFEKVVDVGVCSGPCHPPPDVVEKLEQSLGTLHCQPLRNRTVAIPGPNGDTCVEVIDQCSCSSSCYRATSLEHIYDYALKINEEEDDDDDEEMAQPLHKVIDVGRCVGTCNNPNQKHRCVLRDTEDQSKCLMSLTRRDSSCVPSGYEVHRYRSKSGIDKSILSITDCTCQ